MAGNSNGAPKVSVEARSMLLLRPIPDLLGDGDDEREYRVREGRGQWRQLRPGDHLGLDHALVVAHPAAFAASSELPTTVVVERIPDELRARIDADRRRRLPRIVEAITVLCDNCGQRDLVEVILPPQPTAIDAKSAIDFAEDPWDRHVAAFQVKYLIREWRAAVKARERAMADFKRDHALCAPDVELHPLPEPEPLADGQHAPVWSGPFSLESVGRH